jgi:hypothetical protein
MTQKIESTEVKTIYGSLSDGLGLYCSRPGKASYVCLDSSLLEIDETTQQEVFKVLLDYHRSIPEQSIYRYFLIVKYYEDLRPVETAIAKTPAPEPLPEQISTIRRSRLWRIARSDVPAHIVG